MDPFGGGPWSGCDRGPRKTKNAVGKIWGKSGKFFVGKVWGKFNKTGKNWVKLEKSGKVPFETKRSKLSILLKKSKQLKEKFMSVTTQFNLKTI